MARQSDGADPDAIQRRIRQLRTGLLGGRGPDASPAEIARWQRDRPLLGARPASAERQEVADQAIFARGDPDALGHLIARRRARLSASLAALTGKLRDRRASAGAVLRLVRPVAAAAVTGAAITVAARTALHRRHGGRSTASSPTR